MGGKDWFQGTFPCPKVVSVMVQRLGSGVADLDWDLDPALY